MFTSFSNIRKLQYQLDIDEQCLLMNTDHHTGYGVLKHEWMNKCFEWFNFCFLSISLLDIWTRFSSIELPCRIKELTIFTSGSYFRKRQIHTLYIFSIKNIIILTLEVFIKYMACMLCRCTAYFYSVKLQECKPTSTDC